jgi:hypothetical protein
MPTEKGKRKVWIIQDELAGHGSATAASYGLINWFNAIGYI